MCVTCNTHTEDWYRQTHYHTHTHVTLYSRILKLPDTFVQLRPRSPSELKTIFPLISQCKKNQSGQLRTGSKILAQPIVQPNAQQRRFRRSVKCGMIIHEVEYNLYPSNSINDGNICSKICMEESIQNNHRQNYM